MSLSIDVGSLCLSLSCRITYNLYPLSFAHTSVEVRC